MLHSTKHMSSLESLISVAGEAPMIDSLDFSLPAASTAVVDRKQHLRAYPTSASTLTPTGTKTCRIRLGGDDFVEASSIRIQHTINETGGSAALVPLSGPWGVFGQVYLRSNGQELDNIPSYGRFHQQYGWNQLSQLEQFGEAGICGMGGSWSTGTGSTNRPAMGTIAASSSYTVIHKLHLSLFSSGKKLPTRYAPLEVEVSLGSAADWLDSTKSTSYSISNVQLLYDAVTLDESVQDSFYRALLANRVLSIPTMTVYQMVRSIPSGSTSFTFDAVRAFSKLSHVWLTFRNTTTAGSVTVAPPKASSFICPTTVPAYAGSSPLLADGNAPSARLSIGPHYWPAVAPVATIPEHFYQLQKALPGVPNITRDNFLNDCFTICFDIRRQPEDPSTSLSTRSGDQLHVELLNLTANLATECWMTMFAFTCTCVRENGVTLLT